MAGGNRMRMMVVVPAFAAGQQRDPPVVAGVVAGLEAARAPEMGGGVDQPGRVQAQRGAQKDAPHDQRPAAGDQQNDSQRGQRDPMIFAQQHVEAVFGEVRSVAAEHGGVLMERLAVHDPSRMRPPGAVDRSVRVAGLVAVLVMDAVGGYPKDRTALEGERAANGEEILDPFRRLVAAMGEQAMIAHADAHVDGEEIDDDGDDQGRPGKHEQSGHGAEMEGDHEGGRHPVDLLAIGLRRVPAGVLDGGRGFLGGPSRGGYDLRDGDAFFFQYIEWHGWAAILFTNEETCSNRISRRPGAGVTVL